MRKMAFLESKEMRFWIASIFQSKPDDFHNFIPSSKCVSLSFWQRNAKFPDRTVSDGSEKHVLDVDCTGPSWKGFPATTRTWPGSALPASAPTRSATPSSLAPSAIESKCAHAKMQKCRIKGRIACLWLWRGKCERGTNWRGESSCEMWKQKHNEWIDGDWRFGWSIEGIHHKLMQ